jgi:hypothetical protein
MDVFDFKFAHYLGLVHALTQLLLTSVATANAADRRATLEVVFIIWIVTQLALHFWKNKLEAR